MTLKTCRFGNHPINEEEDRGRTITYYSTPKDGGKTVETHACVTCDRLHRIKQYAEDGVIQTNLWMDASMRHHEREYIQENHGSINPHEVRIMGEYGVRLANDLFLEEQAFGNSLDENLTALLKRITSPRVHELGGITEDVETAFCGPNLFWFDRMAAEMKGITAIGKQWEREVWFGGHDRSQDPEFTEPYPGLECHGARSYRMIKNRIDPKCLPPGSLQAFVIPAKFKGYYAEVDGLKYMSHTMCGRALFQIEDKKTGHLISMMCDEDSPRPRAGLQGICARSEEAIEFFQRAIDDWKAGKINLVQNDGVGFGL